MLDHGVAVIALEFEFDGWGGRARGAAWGCVGRGGDGAEAAAGAEFFLEGFEEVGEFVGALGAWGEAGDDGDGFAVAFFAADADLLCSGVEDFAVEPAWAGAGGMGFAAALAGDGLLKGRTVEEAGWGRWGWRGGRRWGHEGR